MTAPAGGERGGANVVLTLVDGSEEAAAAIRVARTVARIREGDVHVLYVSPRPLAPEELVAGLHLPPPLRHGLVVEQERGRIADVIGRHVAERNATVVVLARRWPSDEPGRDVGWAAEQVLRNVECPVLLVPPGLRWDPEVGCGNLRRFLLPSDGAPSTALGLQPAMALAAECGAEVHVLHVAEPGKVREPERGAMAAPRYIDQLQHEWPAWAGEFLDRLCALPGGCPVRPRIFFATGAPAETILRFARENHDDCICVVWHGRFAGEHARTLRKVVGEATVPVLVLRAPPASPEAASPPTAPAVPAPRGSAGRGQAEGDGGEGDGDREGEGERHRGEPRGR